MVNDIETLFSSIHSKKNHDSFPKPNFFIIGAPKCGTTALCSYLAQHPNIFISKPKEPRYFATDFNVRPIVTERAYLMLFRAADIDQHRAIGEGSTSYLFSHEAVPNIIRFQPDAKLIVMLRNPADLVISLHAQRLVGGVENVHAFEEAWKLEEERRRGKKLPIGTKDPQMLYYSEWGKIGSQLKRVLSVVPKERIFIILFDDFMANTRKVYLETLEFLDVSDDGRTSFPVFNPRREVKMLWLQRLMGVSKQVWLPIRGRLFGHRGLGISYWIKDINSKVSRREIITPEFYAQLVNFFLPEIHILEELLERDLSPWYLPYL